MSFRVGQGFDVHRFSARADRRLLLGGIEVAPEGGLEGHSDADVVVHAVCDALLGAAALGEIGTAFPDTSPEFEGVSSMTLLGRVLVMLSEAGFRPVNADCTIVCERPRLAQWAPRMEDNLTRVLGAPVSVKVKSAEAMGALGRAEGVGCLAVALVESDA